MERLFMFGVICLVAANTGTTPTEESSEVTVENKALRYFRTEFGDIIEVTIAANDLLEIEKCTLENSQGRIFDILNLDIKGVKIMSMPEIACGLEITVSNDGVIGNWTLVFRGKNMHGECVEKRQPFTVNVQELVEALVNDIMIVEGNDFYFRLKEPTEEYTSCKAIGPNGYKYDVHEDTRYPKYCGYILKNISIGDGGTWQIVYGNTITYSAFIQLSVTDRKSDNLKKVLVWVRDRPVEAVIGPEDAIYCRVESPDGRTVFDSIGRCNISLNRASKDHSGIWKMSVGLPGRAQTVDYEFIVKVKEAASKPVVITSVKNNEPIVTLSCSKSNTQPIRACIFWQPSGRVFLATEIAGKRNFNYVESNVSYVAGKRDNDCGVQITNPNEQDVGIWRCALQYTDMKYYGFLTVLPPWLAQDTDDVATTVTDPVLTADRKTVRTMEGDGITMGCSMQEAIRYCYFRFKNGSVYNVGPGFSNDRATYVGAGFAAGECGIRFPVLAASDTGPWTCHVGFPDESKPEQNVHIDVTVDEYIIAVQTVLTDRLLVQAQVYGHSELEYCRFVRSDGLGFTGGIFNMPNRYTAVQNLSTGRCGFVVEQPTMLEHQSWIIVAKVKGQRVEHSAITEDTVDKVSGIFVFLPCTWIVLLTISLSVMLVSIMIGSERNRQWTYIRIAAVSDNFRNGSTKTEPVRQDASNNTGVSSEK